LTEFKDLSETLKVSGQLGLDDIGRVADTGISVIINNRPDGEEASQPPNALLEARAGELGIQWHYIPFSGSGLTMDIVLTMAHALADRTAGTLMFCRTGTRSTNLWALASALEAQATTTDIIAAAAAAGYDLRGMQAVLEQIRPAPN